jgi:hypothetical protein
MAVEVLTINPSKKKKAGSRKGKAMDKKRKKRTTSTAAPKRRRRRRNPSIRGAARAVARRGRSTLGGMNIGAALRSTPLRVGGMMAAKWAAKKFPGVTGGGDKDDWAFSNYLAGGVGGFVAGFIAENLKRGSGQKILEGAIDLLAYKILENEVIPKNAFLSEQFGADDEIMLLGEDDEPIVMLGEDDAEEGDLLLGDDGELYMMGADGYTRPVDESHRILAAELANRALAAQQVSGYGGPLARPGTLGGELSRPGALGGPLAQPDALGDYAVFPPSQSRLSDPFMAAYASRG